MRTLVLCIILGLPSVSLAAPVSSAGKRPTKASAAKRGGPRCRDIFCTPSVTRIDGASGGDVSGRTETQVEEVMASHRGRLQPCLIEARRRDPARKQARLEVVVSGKGRVLASRVDGQRGSPLARCIGKQLTRVRFPSFKLQRTVAAVTLTVPQ